MLTQAFEKPLFAEGEFIADHLRHKAKVEDVPHQVALKVVVFVIVIAV